MKTQSSVFIKTPLVSVVIITYNQDLTLRQTIEYILNQECKFSYEIIIGEDCSVDETRNICLEFQRKFPEKIKLVLFDKNGGLVNNWLTCINEARGKYITSCAGDDYWHNPNKLQLQVDYMEIHLSCGVLHTDFDELNVLTNKITKSYRDTMKNDIPQGYVQKQIFDGRLHISAPTVCIRKELFDKFIPVDKYIELNFPIEDWPTWVILSKYSEVNYLPISTVTYRRGHESVSNLQNYDAIETKFSREKKMYKYLCDIFPNDLIFDGKGYDSYVYSVLLNLAFKQKDYRKANQFGKKIGNKSVKVVCSQNRILFWIFFFFKQVRKSQS